MKKLQQSTRLFIPVAAVVVRQIRDFKAAGFFMRFKGDKTAGETMVFFNGSALTIGHDLLHGMCR